jgi:heparan-alpha-glucosaminide N-acetyltransferase
MPPPALPSGRLVSLDAFRGLIMTTLLFGSVFQSLKGHPRLEFLYKQNEHVLWEGCVYWDLIQPAFMFIVGVAMPIAAGNRGNQSWLLQFLRVLWRAAKLILLGVVLDNFGAKDFNFGFIRVLQQIAIGYVFAFLVVGRSYIAQGLVAAAILLVYTLVWVYNPYNGPGGPWAEGGWNLGKAFDLWMIGRNYSGNYVGLNTIPSTATMIFGVMAGTWLSSGKPPRQIALTLCAAGAAALLVGSSLAYAVPMVKRIWTASFAIYSAGWVAMLLSLFYWVIDGMNWKGWAFPLVVVGMNSIAAYVMGGLFGGWFRSLTTTWIAPLDNHLGAVWFPVFQKALFAVCAWCVLYWLYRKRIFFKL